MNNRIIKRVGGLRQSGGNPERLQKAGFNNVTLEYKKKNWD